MKPAPIEQETVITWNRAENEAFIFTYEPTWQKHLEALGCKCVLNNGWGGKEYVIDKKRIPKPRQKRKISEAQRVKMGERLQKVRKVSKSQ